MEENQNLISGRTESGNSLTPADPQTAEMQRITAGRILITREHLARQMARLDVVYPQNRDPSQTALRYQVFFDALAVLTVDELRTAVDRYLRSNADFGPAPGQLIALSGYDKPAVQYHRRYDTSPEPPAMDPDEATAMIERVHQATGFRPEMLRVKPQSGPIGMTTEMPIRERELADERAATMERRLVERGA